MAVQTIQFGILLDPDNAKSCAHIRHGEERFNGPWRDTEAEARADMEEIEKKTIDLLGDRVVAIEPRAATWTTVH